MIDTGHNTWILISSALVMLMTPGLALFYGGMVRRKNVLSTFMMSFSLLGLVMNLITDLIYTWIDPRIDFESRQV